MTINIFATQTGSIPLSELDTNFATPITIGSTAIALGQTATTLSGVTLASGCVFPIIPISSGGTGTATPSLVAGTNVTITGTWPNQTINSTGGGTGGGTVTSVSGTGTVNGISLSGTVTASGSLTLGGSLSGVSLTSQVTGTLPVANGGTGSTGPVVTAGAGISVTGTWPNQTISATGGGSLVGTTTTTATLLGVSASPSGSGCTNIGYQSGYLTSGTNNSGLGAGTLAGSTGSSNTAVGASSGQGITSGSLNTAIGYNTLSGSTALTGNNNVVIGGQGTVSANSISNEVSLYNGSVHARFQGAASSWSFVSDERDKTNIADLSLGLEFINQLQPRTFEWDMRDNEVDKGKKSSGFIAQEVLAVMQSKDAMYTQLVNTDDENQYTLAQPNLIPMLVNAIKELTARLESLESKNV